MKKKAFILEEQCLLRVIFFLGFLEPHSEEGEEIHQSDIKDLSLNDFKYQESHQSDIKDLPLNDFKYQESLPVRHQRSFTK